MSRIKNNHSPVIYEDGLQTRDFISVHDIVDANILAMEKSSSNYESFNVGTGKPVLNNLAMLPGDDGRAQFLKLTELSDLVGLELGIADEHQYLAITDQAKDYTIPDHATTRVPVTSTRLGLVGCPDRAISHLTGGVVVPPQPSER